MTSLVKDANRIIELYSMDGYKEPGEGGLVAWLDTRNSELVVENEQEQQQRFSLSSSLMRDVEAFVRAKAVEKFGETQTRYLYSSNKNRRGDNI